MTTNSIHDKTYKCGLSQSFVLALTVTGNVFIFYSFRFQTYKPFYSTEA